MNALCAGREKLRCEEQINPEREIYSARVGTGQLPNASNHG